MVSVFGGGMALQVLKRRVQKRAGAKKEMPTPKDEHFVPPVLPGVMFDGRISFDGIATVKNFW
jgi:hypothetical protein